MTLRVLFIDDEKMVLEALRRSMHGKTNGWKMKFVDSVDDFWQLLATETFDAVVTDMQMPGTNGVELAKTLQKTAPETARIVLSGFKDHQEVIRSKGAHRFLMKPIMVTNLIQHLSEAINAPVDADRRAMVFGASDIVTTASTLQHLRDLLDQTDVRISDLTTLISNDPGMSAKVLQLGNSSVFCGHRRGLDVNECLTAIGIDSIRLLLSTDTYWSFAPDDTRDSHVEEALDHAHKVAGRCIANKQLSDAEQTTAHMAAILHVVGSLLEIQSSADHSHGFSCNQADVELATALLQLWGIPSPTVQEVQRIASLGCEDWAS